MINDLDFPGNETLVRQAASLGRNVATLQSRCRRSGIPSIYINDNQGKWRSDFSEVIRYCMKQTSPGRKMVEQILPSEGDYLILKPKHSIFFATPLEVILEYIGVDSLLLAGISTNSCILLSASDAYVRDYQLHVPADCVAGQNDEDHHSSLKLMERNFRANTTPSSEICLEDLLDAGKQKSAA